MATGTKAEMQDPLDLHRRYWSESIDLEVVALTIALHRAYDAQARTARDVWHRHGLTPAEFDVLATLRRSPLPRELTPSQIQAALAITSGGLTKVLIKLESRGLVARSIDAGDQRIRPVRLGAAGKRLVEKAMAELMAASAPHLRSSLSAGDMASATRLLKRIADADRPAPLRRKTPSRR